MIVQPYTFFNKIQDNRRATMSTDEWGTIITGSATAHVKGAYSAGQLIASTDFDSYLLLISAINTLASATITSQLLDIGIGASGSEVTIISNLVVGWRGVADNMGLPLVLPIFIPKGTRIAARAQGAIASDTVDVYVALMGGTSRPPWPIFTKMDDYGVDTATSKGTGHTPGNATYSTWANLGSTLARDYGAAIPIVQGNVDTTMTINSAYWDIGINSVQLATWLFRFSTSERTVGPWPMFPIMMHFPSGTQMMTRAQGNAAFEEHDVALYMLY